MSADPVSEQLAEDGIAEWILFPLVLKMVTSGGWASREDRLVGSVRSSWQVLAKQLGGGKKEWIKFLQEADTNSSTRKVQRLESSHEPKGRNTNQVSRCSQRTRKPWAGRIPIERIQPTGVCFNRTIPLLSSFPDWSWRDAAGAAPVCHTLQGKKCEQTPVYMHIHGTQHLLYRVVKIKLICFSMH